MLLAKGCKRLLRLQPKPKKSTTVKGGGHQHPVRSGVDQGQQPQGDSGPVNVHAPVPATQQLICHPARSLLTGAHDFHINRFDFVDSSKTIQGNGYVDASQHITVNKYNGAGESSGWDTLLQNTSPSALLDSQSYDAGRCDDDTRLDVLSDIDAWIHNTTSPQKLLCITGPVGCGKSALQRTTAERCSAKGTLAASFFFSSTDPTRNDTAYFIPTLAYQLASDPGIRATIVQCIDTDPLVFKKSLRSQMDAMVISPIRQAIVTAKLSGETYPLPNVIVIDGLDECKSDSMQTELLKALEHLVRSLSAVGFPLRVIVTSRPEWTIWSAVEVNGHISTLTRHLKLADEYDATEDIRRYVTRHLGEIASRARDPRVRARGGWPAEEDVDALVHNASGQFIYVVVALNYIGERHSSPVDRLKTVLSWSPAEGKHQAHPLSPLDTLYAGILENAQEAYEEFEHTSGVDSIVMLIRLHQFNKGARFKSRHGKGLSLDLPGFEAFLGMQDGETYGLISDMRSLLTIREGPAQPFPLSSSEKEVEEDAPPAGYDHIHFYHKSLLDFLDDSSRAGELYVPNAEVACHFAVCALQQITGAFDHDIETLLQGENTLSSQIADSSRLRVLSFSFQILSTALPDLAHLTHPFLSRLYTFTEAAGWEKLDKYVKETGTGTQYASAFSTVLTLYAAKCFDEGIFEDHSKGQLAKLMDIVGDHRRSWAMA